MSYRRRFPIVIGDVRSLGGVVSIVPAHDRLESGGNHFRINYASRGRDLVFLSTKLPDEKSALAAATVLGELLNAKVESNK